MKNVHAVLKLIGVVSGGSKEPGPLCLNTERIQRKAK